MSWMEFWPLLALACYVFIFFSLYLGCSICRVSGLSAAKLAVAAIAIAIPLGAFNIGFISFARSFGSSLSSGSEIIILPVWFIANFLICLLIGPWFFRSEESGWGAALGGSALGGVFFIILLVGSWYVIGSMEAKAAHAKVVARKTSALASYGLPYPASAEFDDVILENSGDAIAHAREHPDYKRWSPAWVERWPCNATVMFRSAETPAALADYLEKSLGQAGFKVRRSGNDYVTGANGTLFAAYQISNGTCLVRVWKDFATEMEAVSAAEM